MAQAQLPIIDMGAYRSGDAQTRAAVIAEIAARSRELGFFYIVNHGAPQSLLEDQLAWNRRFFALPLAERQAVDFNRSPVRRGYEPLAAQTLQAGMQPDRKETFNFGQEAAAGEQAPFEGPNQWPNSTPDFDALAFRRQMERYRDATTELGRELCSLIAASLDLPDDYFANALAHPNTNVRLLHYPPQNAAPRADQLGCGAHTDWGFITILLQDDCGGLEIQRPSGEWLSAKPIPGALIVNLGDMVVKLTAGRYASNVHRVLNLRPDRSRHSVAAFFNPHASYQVACVPTCMPATGAAPPITFSDHIEEMIHRTYAPIGAPIDAPIDAPVGA